VTGPYATPPIGTQGQLWMVLYSNGYPATAFFIGFYLAVLWQTRRPRSIAGIWLHAVPVVALAQIIVYGWLPVELYVVMAVAALAYRRCWRPGDAAEAGITRPARASLALPEPVAGPRAVAAELPQTTGAAPPRALPGASP
jgi:hypothetical protein